MGAATVDQIAPQDFMTGLVQLTGAKERCVGLKRAPPPVRIAGDMGADAVYIDQMAMLRATLTRWSFNIECL